MNEAGGRREGRSLRGFGKTFETRRPADANLFVENEPSQFARAGQLRGAAGQNNTAASDLVEARSFEAFAHQLEGLFEPWRDDADEQRFRHVVGVAVIFFADERNGDGLALVVR